MGLLTLYAGILLPWLGGTLWLMFADAGYAGNTRPNRLRQLGYGFFLGYAVLFLAVMASHGLTGAVSWPALMAFLALFALGGAIAVRLVKTPSGKSPPLPAGPATSVSKALLVAAIGLMAIHLVFFSVEIFTQPLYPWDAWLAWVYRAKAWYLSGGMTGMVGADEWARAAAANVYTIDAWQYPLFPSVVPYWAALSLGRWSETLVNLPVLFAGLAMGMALYGQCREHGFGIPASLLACYVLYSIPILGTHLALAGYADIWMAGFAGLGLVAVTRGLITRGDTGRPGLQTVLGLLMITFGIWVKNEGAVWLLASLALIVLVTCRPRVPVLILAVAALVGTAAYAVGFSHVQLPLLGTLGFVDGRLVIPFIGSFRLEAHDVLPVYWSNFVEMGSWNLFWLAVAAALVLGIGISSGAPADRTRRTVLGLLSIVIATQVFIFGLTDQGLWADTYTAINRLPLHFAPALLFAVFVAYRARLESDGGRTGRRGFATWLAAGLLAATLVSVGAVYLLSRHLPQQATEPLAFGPGDLHFAFGAGNMVEDLLQVDTFADGYALLSSGPIDIQADDFRVLRYTWLPPHPHQEAAFFWRRADDPDNVSRADITTPGTQLLDLTGDQAWSGKILETGFLVAGENGEPVTIGTAELLPDSLETRLQLTWKAWTGFEDWSQQSINFLYGGSQRQDLSLPLLVAAWLVVTLLLAWVLRRAGILKPGEHMLLIAGGFFLLGWMLLDVRWTADNIRHVRVALDTRLHADEQQRLDAGLDGEIHRYVQRLKTSVLGRESARVLIIGDEGIADYYLFRAKYHLLPFSAHVARRFTRELTPESVDYVIFIGEPTGLPDMPGFRRAWQNSLVNIDSGEWGMVFRVKKP